MDEQRKRVEKAVDIVLARKVEDRGLDRYRVEGSKPDTFWRVDLDHDYCTCPDHGKHPELSCKHIIAAELYKVFKRRGVL
jgi:uncharacterized Zn finger protein